MAQAPDVHGLLAAYATAGTSGLFIAIKGEARALVLLSRTPNLERLATCQLLSVEPVGLQIHGYRGDDDLWVRKPGADPPCFTIPATTCAHSL